MSATAAGSDDGTLVNSRFRAFDGSGAFASCAAVGCTIRLVTSYCTPRVFWPWSPTSVRPTGWCRRTAQPMFTLLTGYGMGNHPRRAESAAEMRVWISLRWTWPRGRSAWNVSGTSWMCR